VPADELKRITDHWATVTDDARWCIISTKADADRSAIFHALTAENQKIGKTVKQKYMALPPAEQEAAKQRGQAEWAKLAQGSTEDF